MFIILNILIGLLDGIGLAMFIPLIQIALSKATFDSKTLGKFHFVTDWLQKTGIQLNIENILLILVVLFSLKGLMRYFQKLFLAKIKLMFFLEVRNNLLDMLKDISYRGFLKIDSGRIQNGILSEVPRLYTTMTGFFDAIQCAVMLGIYYMMALFSNYQFTLLVIVFAILVSLIYRKFFHNTQNLSIDFSKKGDQFSGHVVQSINHFKYLKATNTFKKYLARIKQIVFDFENINIKMAKSQATSEGIKEPIAVTIICAVIYIQHRFFPANNIGSVMICLLLFYRALSQLSLMQISWQSFIQNIGSMYSIASLSQEMESMKENYSNKIKTNIGEIELKNIGLEYDDFEIFNNLNLKIEKNTTVAFVGESGSGKTSLANIIIGLFPPTKGEIFINHHSFSELDLLDYRSRIGYISQESVIFNDTIFNNVTFFDKPDEQNYQRFQHVVELSSLTQFVDSLPNKEQSILGDNGILISGGQRQRISIARELYKQCELLVLDEATSALDSETENIIKENIEKLKGNYTIIIIAHRLSTIKNADVIYFFKDKTIAEKGTFGELMETSEHFKKMVQTQAF